MFSGRGCRTLVGTLLLYVSVLAGTNCGRVKVSPLSHERYQVTTFGAEKRARWSLEGKTAVVTGGTKVWVTGLRHILLSCRARRCHAILRMYMHVWLALEFLACGRTRV